MWDETPARTGCGGRSCLQQLLSERDGDGFGAGGGTELLEEGEDVRLDAGFTDAELPCAVVVGESSGDQKEYLVLT